MDIHSDQENLALRQSAIFFDVVRMRPSALVRNKLVGEKGFAWTDRLIAPHKLEWADFENKRVHIRATSLQLNGELLNQGLIMDVSKLSGVELCSSKLWHFNQMNIGCKEFRGSPLQHAFNRIVFHCAEQFSSASLPEASDANNKCMIELMVERGWLCKMEEPPVGESGEWFEKTELFAEMLEATCDLSSPKSILAVRENVALEDRTVWELVCMLTFDGWRHCIPTSKQKKMLCDKPYDPADATSKVWYTSKKCSIMGKYLMALHMATTTVHHFQAQSYYASILAGEIVEPTFGKEKKNEIPRCILNDDMDALPPARKKRKAAQAVLALMDGVESDRLEAKDSSSSSSRSSSSSSSSSTSSTSSSSSSSSSNSSSDSKSTRSRSHVVMAEAPGADPIAVPDGVEFEHGMPFGRNWLTPHFKKSTRVQIGWQMWCRHPKHQDPIPCRLKRNLHAKGRTPEETLQYLKMWCVLGNGAPSHDDHAAFVGLVDEAFDKGEIPVEPIEPAEDFDIVEE